MATPSLRPNGYLALIPDNIMVLPHTGEILFISRAYAYIVPGREVNPLTFEGWGAQFSNQELNFMNYPSTQVEGLTCVYLSVAYRLHPDARGRANPYVVVAILADPKDGTQQYFTNEVADPLDPESVESA